MFILISYYFEFTKKKEHLAAGVEPFTKTPDDFLSYPIGGLRAIIEFLNLWAVNHKVPQNFLMVKYEDLHKDTSGVVKGILGFIGEQEIDENALKQAIEFSKFDNMRKLEEKGVAGLKINPHVKKGDTEGYKTRKGQVGNYKSYLSNKSCQEMESIIAEKLSTFYGTYTHKKKIEP